MSNTNRGFSNDMAYYKSLEPFWGEWRIEEPIGEGSSGKVFRIVKVIAGVEYRSALKIISVPKTESEWQSVKSEGLDDASVTSFFCGVVDELSNEIKLMSELKGHSNIVSYEDDLLIAHPNQHGWDILVRMELLTPFINILPAESSFNRDQVIKLGIDMCKALEVCHSKNIIHRDIKPENIFISQTGDYKLGDFGISRTVERTTGVMSKKGTYTYMAPEVFKTEEYGKSVDIYSLGIILYRLLNRHRTPFLPPYPAPIEFPDKEKALNKRFAGEIMPLPIDAQDELGRIILKACAYQPVDRFRTATEFRLALERIQTQLKENENIKLLQKENAYNRPVIQNSESGDSDIRIDDSTPHSDGPAIDVKGDVGGVLSSEEPKQTDIVVKHAKRKKENQSQNRKRSIPWIKCLIIIAGILALFEVIFGVKEMNYKKMLRLYEAKDYNGVLAMNMRDYRDSNSIIIEAQKAQQNYEEASKIFAKAIYYQEEMDKIGNELLSAYRCNMDIDTELLAIELDYCKTLICYSNNKITDDSDKNDCYFGRLGDWFLIHHEKDDWSDDVKTASIAATWAYGWYWCMNMISDNPDVESYWESLYTWCNDIKSCAPDNDWGQYDEIMSYFEDIKNAEINNENSISSETINDTFHSDTSELDDIDNTTAVPDIGTNVIVPADTGSVLNIYTWNEEFKTQLENYYPGYIKVDATTGKIGDVTIKYIITPTDNNAYQNKLDTNLVRNDSVMADDKIDIFLIEADYAKKYVNDYIDVAMKISDLGITDGETSEQYQYTKDVATDERGNQRGTSWQAFPGVLIYNREAARKVLGSDSPEDVQVAVKDWDSYKATAAKMAEQGYLMTATAEDTYRAYSSNATTPWVSNGTILIDSNREAWAKASQEMVRQGYTTDGSIWSVDWSEGFYPQGKVFCYFGPMWFWDACMGNAKSSSIASQGGWGVVKGPQSFSWGGTWIVAANGTDNPNLVADIMRTMTMDEDIMLEMARNEDCINNRTAMKRASQDSECGFSSLGGQNPYSILDLAADSIDISNVSEYDYECDNVLQEIMMEEYIGGNKSYETALEDFYKEIEIMYPALYH